MKSTENKKNDQLTLSSIFNLEKQPSVDDKVLKSH